MSEHWEIVPEKSKDHWLEVKDPEGWRSAVAKWDGCVDYYRYYNTPMDIDPENDADMTDYIHICNIDEEIARLQALKRVAANWFNDHGHPEHWRIEEVESVLANPFPLE